MDRRMYRAVMLVMSFVFVFAAAGCGSKNDTVVTAAAVSEDQSPNIFRVNLTSNPSTFDPAQAYTESEMLLSRTLFDTLVGYKDGEIKPKLAESWRYSENGRELYIQLRDNLKFSNGRPLTSADVEFSLERIINGVSPYGPLLSAFIGGKEAVINSIEPLGNSSLVIRFPKARRDFIELLANPCFSIVSKADVENNNWAKQPVVGTGPFRMSEVVTDRSVTLEPNPHYYSTVPKIDRLELIIDTSQEMTMYDFGTEYLDMAYLPTADIKTLITGYPFIQEKLFTGPADSVYFLSLNPKTKLFGNVAARQAVISAIDVSKLMDASEAFIVSESPLRRLSRDKGRYTGDPKVLLHSLGYGEGGKMPEIVFSYPPGEISLFIAENIKTQLESSLGVKVKLIEGSAQKPDSFNSAAHLSLIKWVVPSGFEESSFFPYFFGQGVNPFVNQSVVGDAARRYFEETGTVDKLTKRDHYYGLISNEICKDFLFYGLVDVKRLYAVQEKGRIPGELEDILGIGKGDSTP